MKKVVLALITLASLSAFADDYTVNCNTKTDDELYQYGMRYTINLTLKGVSIQDTQLNVAESNHEITIQSKVEVADSDAQATEEEAPTEQLSGVCKLTRHQAREFMSFECDMDDGKKQNIAYIYPSNEVALELNVIVEATFLSCGALTKVETPTVE